MMKYLSTGQQGVLFFLALVLLTFLYFQFYHPPAPSPEQSEMEIVVEVQGDVKEPGIYLFRNPPTLRDALEKAGGILGTPSFDTGSSSEFLETGTLLTIRKDSQDQVKAKWGRMEARKLLVFSIPLDLNRVTEEDLRLVPGIGEGLAREILIYRRSRGGFRSVEELKEVKGIGERNYPCLNNFFVVR